MKSIEIVSHCWRYSRALNYQLASLLLHPPAAQVTLTVCYSTEDRLTGEVLNWSFPLFGGGNVRIQYRAQEIPELLNRSIGRHRAALASRADLVWFADCDYWFGPGCLDTLATMDVPDESTPLVFPGTILQNATRENGDEYALRVAGGPCLPDIDPADFVPARVRKAIGGLQIVRGETARRVGYCPNSQRPVRGDRWQTTRGDVEFRSILGPRGTPITLPNLYRIRQSVERQCDTLTAATADATADATATTHCTDAALREPQSIMCG